MSQRAKLDEWEAGEGTQLEKGWGQRLQVPFHSFDDSDVYKFGICRWKPQYAFHALAFVPKYEEACVVETIKSQRVLKRVQKGDLMVADGPPVATKAGPVIYLEGGGVVPLGEVRPANHRDLGLNPSLQVFDVPKKVRRTKSGRSRRCNVSDGEECFSMDGPQICRFLLFLSTVFLVCPPDSQITQYTDDCLVQSLWNHGCKVQKENGPHWALADGNRLLQKCNKTLMPVLCPETLQPGKRYILHVDGSVVDFARRLGKRGTWYEFVQTPDGMVDQPRHVDDHFVAVRTFDNGFDIKDGEELHQEDGSVIDFARWLGNRGTWYELVQTPDAMDDQPRAQYDRRGGMQRKRTLYSPETRRRILDRWEPEKFRRMRSQPSIVLEEEKEDEGENVAGCVSRVIDLMAQATEDWTVPLCQSTSLALRIVALCVVEPILWARDNDLLVTRVAALLLDDVVAHPDGVHRYRQGAYSRIEDIPNVCILKMESVIARAQIILNHMKCANVSRDLEAVFWHVRDSLDEIEASPPVTSRDLLAPKGDFAAWAMDACRDLRDCAPRFTSKAHTEKIVDLLGSWMHVPRPEAPFVSVAFEDCAMRIDDEEEDPDNRVRQVSKSRENLCYFFIPIRLVDVAPDWALDELALLLATSYAGTEAGRDLDIAYEALSWMNKPTPPVVLFLVGVGGNSKSARTILRNNVFAGHHRVLTFDMLQVPKEFRIQGGKFAHAKSLTIQECSPGKPLLEAEFKRFASGEYVACRPLFGKETAYYRWNNCAKYWELNMQFPSIEGDCSKLWELRSMTRRIRVITLRSIFTSDSGAVDIENARFKEDADLMDFLEGPYVRLAYVKHFLIPYIRAHTAEECRKRVLDPPLEIMEATRRVVAQMANGGLEVPAAYRTAEQDDQRLKEARDIVVKAHTDVAPSRKLKEYDVCRVCKSVPGAFRPNKAGTPTRLDNLRDAMDSWPHLIHLTGGKDLVFLDLNYPKFESILAKHGAEKFGGGFESWRPVWDRKHSLSVSRTLVAPPQPEQFDGETEEVFVHEVEEWVNVVALTAVDEGETAKSRRVRLLLERYRREGTRHGDFCAIKVRYVRKHGLPGRWYAQGPSIQSHLTKATRSEAFSTEIGASACANQVFVDVDINNCFLTLFVKALQEKGADMQDFQVMCCFSTHYRAWREFLAEFLGISIKAAKKQLIRLVHLGLPLQDIPFLWELAYQIDKAVDFLLDLDMFQHLKARFTDRPNPRATRLHYALAALEETVMSDLVETVSHIPNCHINAFMCDGAIVRIDEGSMPSLRTELESIGARQGVTLSFSSFDRLGGASRPNRRAARDPTPRSTSHSQRGDPFSAKIYPTIEEYRLTLAQTEFVNREEFLRVVKHAVVQDPSPYADVPSVRALVFAQEFGLIEREHVCVDCGAPFSLRYRSSLGGYWRWGGPRYDDSCATCCGKEKRVGTHSVLAGTKTKNWLSKLDAMVMFCKDYGKLTMLRELAGQNVRRTQLRESILQSLRFAIQSRSWNSFRLNAIFANACSYTVFCAIGFLGFMR